MANQEHLDILKQGVEMWNQWREEHPNIRPDLREAYLMKGRFFGANFTLVDLHKAELSFAHLCFAKLNHAYLSGANLTEAILIDAELREANFRESNLHEAILNQADLTLATLNKANFSSAQLIKADMTGVDLREAGLYRADLSEADLSYADLSGAYLDRATLVGTIFAEAILTNCHIYGIAAWDVELTGAKQIDLVITPEEEPTITVDNLKIAQFIYLLLNNTEIRDAIDTIAKKAILILGRFSPERKAVLDALRDALRLKGYLPILFDFNKPARRDITETVSTLAHLARFVIADITDAKSIPQELMTIVPNLPSVPVQPLILSSQREYGMFEHFTRFPWVLPVYHYTEQARKVDSFVKTGGRAVLRATLLLFLPSYFLF